MNKRLSNKSLRTLYALVSAALIFAFSTQGFAQTAADTAIKNTASATYSDGTDDYSTVSNEVTVTVAKVAGLTITPDQTSNNQSNSAVVAGQTGVTMTFRVTNTGNFSNDVRFLASGASVRALSSGTAAPTITAATADGTDILANTAAVDKTLAQNGFIDVVVTVSIAAGASPGDVITVFLGDAASGTNFDNVEVGTTANPSSTNEVRTVSTAAVNGLREARGDIRVTVENNALPRVNLTAPAGPVALGSTITYSAEACNAGSRDLGPVSPATQIYVYAPIPVGTQLASLPSGASYTTDALTTAPLAATWSTATPVPFASVTRIRIPVGASIAAATTVPTCASAVNFDVTITTTNATAPIYEIVDLIGSNTLGTTVTDQSGDAIANRGDLNANFNEPLFGGTVSSTQGFQLPTLLQQTGGVFIGPLGSPQANGPTNNNDDFTNKSVNTGIASVAPGGVTTDAGTVVFVNTVENDGNADDTYTLTAPTVPTGFTVRICVLTTCPSFATSPSSWTTVSGGGSTTINVAYNSTANISVMVTAPTGEDVLTGFETVIRATSGIDSNQQNDTIDRLYTGFIRLDKTVDVANSTGVGGATDAVPGAVVTYTVTYTNVSEAGTPSGSVGLTANDLVITENGSAGTNNWGATTTRLVISSVGQEFDYSGSSGAIVGTGTVVFTAAAGSVPDVYTDTIATLAPQAVGRFVFKRTIN
jgi:hypothetical protein